MMDLPLTQSQIVAAAANAAREGKIHLILDSFDQFWNSITPGGLPDETISAHTRRVVDDPTAKHKLLAKVLNHLLDDVQADHGAKAEVGDATRATKVLRIEDAALSEAVLTGPVTLQAVAPVTVKE